MSVWTPERVETIKTMWADGHSASIIASRIGGVSRNAVIGKLHRMGLAGKRSRSRATRVRKPPRVYATRLVRPAWTQQIGQLPLDPHTPAVEPIIPTHERKPLLVRKADGHLHANDEFTNDSCRWPCGDPQDADFGFCGRKKVEGISYCLDHARIAYQPPQPRRRQAGVVTLRKETVPA